MSMDLGENLSLSAEKIETWQKAREVCSYTHQYRTFNLTLTQIKQGNKNCDGTIIDTESEGEEDDKFSG